ncbi:Tetraspanin-7 [Orchesella cincta]|uniref:Tetraspanin-7 n=1 Tax=Orchesella cincta TaxID=48709 RepID=A0A1D2NLP4_ORCCI|nr:Tetraspanin-7 [Orchesella cincta]
MKWYAVPAIVTCSLNSMLASTVLCLSAFHLYSDKGTNAPTKPNEEWINLVSVLAIFAAIAFFGCLAGLWVSMMRRQLWLTSGVLALYSINFCTAIYFSVMFGQQLEMEEVSAEDLFQRTLKEIKESHQNEFWIPEWLDNIQKQSKFCCGVRTYRDYNELWSAAPTSLPRSCCRVPSNSLDVCPMDLTQVPFPHTPSQYFKVERGCMAEINQATERHMEECFYTSIFMAVLLGVGFLSYLLLYVKRYLSGPTKGSSSSSRPRGKAITASITYLPDLDMGSNQKQNINMTSSNQLVTPIDSVDGVNPIVSVDSFVPASKAVDPKLLAQAAPIPPKAENEVGVHGHKVVKVKPSITKINKANTVFAGIQQYIGGGSEASTGDDMTVGAGNLGRQEVFVAQDTSGSPTSFPDTAGSGSFDDIGDVVVNDPESGNPPGSGSPRRKKERKLGMSRRRRQQQQNM